jgi:hypothetical protein
MPSFLGRIEKGPYDPNNLLTTARFDGGGSGNDYNNLLTERGGTDLARSHDFNNLLTVR